jgi:hypothetical protein
VSLLLALGVLGPVACGGGSSGGAALGVANAPAARTVTGVLVTAAGDSPADYAVYGVSPDAADGGVTAAAHFAVNTPPPCSQVVFRSVPQGVG